MLQSPIRQWNLLSSKFRFNYLFSAIFVLVFSEPTVAQNEALTANQAYEYLQDQRAAARPFYNNIAKPSIDSLKKAEQILLNALDYYDRPDVQKLAEKDQSLFYRKGDISFDLAYVLAKMGKGGSAARILDYPLNGKYGASYAGMIVGEPAFREVRKDSAVSVMIGKLLALKRIFNSEALKTPYQVNISDDEKVAGLSKFWSEVKYNFAYFDHIPEVDWDKLYLEYLPKVRATKSTVEYLMVLKSFCAQLHDGHTDVYPRDKELVNLTSYSPPIATVLIGGKVFVQEVFFDSLEKTGISPGLEIVKIDGIDVNEYANQFVRPYQSGSSIQNVNVQTYTYHLLRGSKDNAVKIEFRDRKGKVFEREISRSGYRNIKPRSAFKFQILPGNIAYVQLNEFESNKALDGFKVVFDSISKTTALIIDIRKNGGGNSRYGFEILGFLTNKTFFTGSYTSRIYSPVRRARGESVIFEKVEDIENGLEPNGKRFYQKPVVVLTGGRTFSAAEDFAVAFDAMKRGLIIGEATGGSTGQPLGFSLPGGIEARVCTKRDAYPDGTEWNGKGIQPNIVAKPTVKDFQSGIDTVLNAALSFLKTNNKPE